MRKALLLVCVFAAGGSAPVLAANAAHPYQNCDRKVDSCGPTGDNMTDQLNGQQLGRSGGGDTATQGGSTPGGAGMPLESGTGVSR